MSRESCVRRRDAALYRNEWRALAEGLTFFAAEVEADSGQAMMWRSHSGENGSTETTFFLIALTNDDDEIFFSCRDPVWRARPGARNDGAEKLIA